MNYGINTSIVNECTDSTSKGIVDCWVFNRNGLVLSYNVDNNYLVENISVNTPCFKISSLDLSAGYTLIDDRFYFYQHFFSVKITKKTAAYENLISKIGDIAVVTEDRDGIFRIYGAKFGLFKSEEEHRANEEKGVKRIRFQNREISLEKTPPYVFFNTSYEVSRGILENLRLVNPLTVDNTSITVDSTLITADQTIY